MAGCGQDNAGGGKTVPGRITVFGAGASNISNNTVTFDSHNQLISDSYNVTTVYHDSSKAKDQPAVNVRGGQTDELGTPDLDVKLPEVWPDKEAKYHDPHKITVSSVEKESEMYTLFKSAVAQKTPSVYPMQQKIRGVFLLINNETFDKAAANRRGTEVDASALEQLFDQLGFVVDIHTNCTAKQMQDLVESQFKSKDHKQYDCFACAILTHGKRGMILGVDGEELSLDTLTDIVTGSQCPSLVGKPKLFFIQACQGDRTDHGVEKEDGGTREAGCEEDTVIFLDSEVFDNGPGANMPQKGKTAGGGVSVCTSDGPLVTSGGDLFVVNATISGFQALRNEQTGTWFIQAVVYIFSQFAHKFDLCRLMLLVKKLVSSGVGRVYVNRMSGQTQPAKQQPAIGPDTLNRQLFFFPGLTEHQRR